ncbi:MAG: hypothetical protein AAGG38_01695 [Planctomycetota bacterium]
MARIDIAGTAPADELDRVNASFAMFDLESHAVGFGFAEVFSHVTLGEPRGETHL